ncbi:hypothetical protein [Stieleria neptunia]|uniref:hypothetical protein n=1 Tax=Stieleria neptunia TaxID=2527979 RepID=UPI0011A0DADB|nr:hypothetical protein [Stieleria neptunia]
MKSIALLAHDHHLERIGKNAGWEKKDERINQPGEMRFTADFAAAKAFEINAKQGPTQSAMPASWTLHSK